MCALCSVGSNKTSHTGYTGLENQGATCYLNTVLQILYMTPEFRNAVNKDSKEKLTPIIAELFERLDSRDRRPASTERITSALKINVHKQEDAAKCLQEILNKVDSEISQVFRGKLAQTTSYKNPEEAHEPLKQVESFFIISISLDSKSPVDMQTCFDSYFQPIMSGEVYCNHCEKMLDTEMVSSLQEVPPVLVLHLERFEFDYDSMRCVKNHSSVKIPAWLTVKKESDEDLTYDLYAVVNHSGSLIRGHYYADIRDDKKQWYQFDDSKIKKIKRKQKLKKLISDKAYLLLYRKSLKPNTAPNHSLGQYPKQHIRSPKPKPPKQKMKTRKTNKQTKNQTTDSNFQSEDE